MTKRRRILSVLLPVFVIVGAWAAQKQRQNTTAEAPSRPADFVIRAGAIHTMAQGNATMRSIAIGRGVLLAVGKAPHDLDRFIGSSTQVMDDSGLTLLPGFIDTHTHLIYVASDAISKVRLVGNSETDPLQAELALLIPRSVLGL